jgi:hypothetical protein
VPLDALVAAAAAAEPQESSWESVKQQVMQAVHDAIQDGTMRPSEIQELIAVESEKRNFPIKLEDRSAGRLPPDSKRAWVMAEWTSWQETATKKRAASSSSESTKKRKTEETKESKLKQFKQSLDLTFALFEELRGKPLHYVRREVVESMFHS